MRPSDEQRAVINAPLSALSVTACAGSGKTATAVRRLIAIRQQMGNNRGRVALLSFSNVAVKTFNDSYAQLAADLPDDANRRRVEVDTLDGFFTQHILRPHAHRTMESGQTAYLVSGSEAFLDGFRCWRDEGHPIAIKDVCVGVEAGAFVFFTGTEDRRVNLDFQATRNVVKKLGRCGAYTHELGRYWVYQTLRQQPAVLRALVARYPQLVVDEAQDLGSLHQAILELLIKAGVQVSLIGDVNQGIYGFAGADGQFLNTYWDREGVIEHRLTRNYRSLPSIVSVANTLCGRNDEPDRLAANGGAYFAGYRESQLPKLFDAFKAAVHELGMTNEDAVVLSRGAARAAVLSGKLPPPGQGTVALFAEGALLRDQQGKYRDSFKLVCRAVVGLLEQPPNGLCSELIATPKEEWVFKLRRLLWTFVRNSKTGLPCSTLPAKAEWHPALMANVRSLLKSIEGQLGLKHTATLGNKLARKGLENCPLAGETQNEAMGPGVRVDTVHQVKGESIGAVLYVTKKSNVEALLKGTGTEEGRIGYVAVTRARNLLWIAVPQAALKELRATFLASGLVELKL